MLTGESNDIEKIADKLKLEMSFCLNICNSASGLIKIVSSAVGKQIAAQSIASKFNVKADNIIAIGDGENDIELLKQVGCSIAVCNANDVVKNMQNI